MCETPASVAHKIDDAECHFLSPIYGDSDAEGEKTLPFTPEVSKTLSMCSMASSQIPFDSTSLSERDVELMVPSSEQNLVKVPSEENVSKKLHVFGTMVSKAFFPNKWKGVDETCQKKQSTKPCSSAMRKSSGQKRILSSDIDVACPVMTKVERTNQKCGPLAKETGSKLAKSRLPLSLKKYATVNPGKDDKEVEPRKSICNISTKILNLQECDRSGLQSNSQKAKTISLAAKESNTVEGLVISRPECEVTNKDAPKVFECSSEVNMLPVQKRSLAVSRPLADCGNQENTAVTVAVRVRPLNERELSSGYKCVMFVLGQTIQIQHPQTNQHLSFQYDFCFWSLEPGDSSYASQEVVYNQIAQPLLQGVFQGYNMCLFAYGQTGSGKSYTMMGFNEEAGIIPRFCEELFQNVGCTGQEEVKYNVEMSYFEIYNEKIHDLLTSPKDQALNKVALKVREHPTFGPYVAGLSTYVIASFADVQTWLELGNKQRATAATGMNEKSSRSHSVFILSVSQTMRELLEGEVHDHTRTSRVNLVDLAGSERCNSAQTSGVRLKEGASINKSLLTLGKVISALSEMSEVKKRSFIPYRDSLLTWLLRESLGGNSKTAMIATVSPATVNLEESLSTLRYASQARNIINVARVNEDSTAALIRELKAEIDKLKAAQQCVQGVDQETYDASLHEIQSLRERLFIQEKELTETQKSWEEKLELAKQQKEEEAKELQKAGVCFKVDNMLPNLVNLNEDPQLSEVLLYIIKKGQTMVGKQHPGSDHEIQLTGALIAENHCLINNKAGQVSLTPLPDAETFINGNLVRNPIVLHHGDRVILGGNHYFRFNHPTEVDSVRRSVMPHTNQEGPRDFEFAKNELIEAQTQRIENEIEDARLQAQTDMMKELQAAKEMAQMELTQQKNLYENRIRQLERELEEELERKRSIKRSLKESRPATGRDHLPPSGLYSQVLELEKETLVSQVEKMQQQGKKSISAEKQAQWTALQLSIALQEANTISKSMNKHTVFSRYDLPVLSGEEQAVYVRVTNTKLGISTMWSQGKFEEKLVCMRELYQGSFEGNADDLFYDPTDTWEAESKQPSPKRTRNSLSRQTSGLLLGKVPTDVAVSSATFSSVCKQLVISEAELLGKEKDFPGLILQLLTHLHEVWTSTNDVLLGYEQLEFGDLAVQPHLIKVSTAFSRMTTSAQFLDAYPEHPVPCPQRQLLDELKKLGGSIAFLLHGCECDITSMIKSSKKQINQSVTAIAARLGQLSVSQRLNFSRGPEEKCGMEHTELISQKITETFIGAVEESIGSQIDFHLKEVISLEEQCQKVSAESHKLAEDLRKSLLPVGNCLKNFLNKIKWFWAQYQTLKAEKTEDAQDPAIHELYYFYSTIAYHLTSLTGAWKQLSHKGLQFIAERGVDFTTMRTDLEVFSKNAPLLAKAFYSLYQDTADQHPGYDLSLVTKDFGTAVHELHSSARDLLRLVEVLGGVNCFSSGMFLPPNNRQLPGGSKADLGFHIWGRSRDSVRVAVAKWNHEALLREKINLERKRTV
ncbi:kinesin-like protein KIF14 isoform X2 [Xenopus tropicalis]|uniref:Kinesin-like protein KIF14 n=1 Tax=Xenopus tropicalis TaxID=8364 RepID=A0A1B8YA23_XENTR|nr:kinesin-like protein KIF14 isoform X2 [Xenopus tropicalis]|eukprot:XP_017944894.1 PREDICTED: kinesin-like protein KIF14 isoform X2 [Xenopus tropicalis]